ncbi:hypothetical protein GUJ93_ZPchr0001g30181 [Zizania palustris]|uniref:RING-type domain-containing protein n=1 Tax=Zizania palustris TaxID=103762 RepID=A0A8J5SAH7_ZIZPA|nr:hypothetical protein GUJ93_ZPchr0001g30181 [Zizania palustris]
MAAVDGHHPHPTYQNPLIPLEETPVVKHLPPKQPPAVVGQVAKSPSYEIAGKVLLAASGAFAGILLALVVLHVYNSGRRGFSRHRRRLLRSVAISGEDDRDGGAAPSPRGLNPAVLIALPVVTADAASGDCAVCLAEFEDGDKARALPRCGHRFHVECIDAWFRENSTCPLCRADVEAPTDAQPEVRIDVNTGDGAPAAAEKVSAPAMRRLPSGTDLEKARRVFASTRSASF